jgi:hypothetical protein
LEAVIANFIDGLKRLWLEPIHPWEKSRITEKIKVIVFLQDFLWGDPLAKSLKPAVVHIKKKLVRVKS